MLGLILFLVLGVAVSNHGSPLKFAGLLVVLFAVLGLMGDDGLVEILIATLISFPFVAFTYLLVERHADSILATYGILLGAIGLMTAAVFYV